MKYEYFVLDLEMLLDNLLEYACWLFWGESPSSIHCTNIITTHRNSNRLKKPHHGGRTSQLQMESVKTQYIEREIITKSRKAAVRALLREARVLRYRNNTYF